MPSRPQFSLRMLLLVVVMASLIAATVAPTQTSAPTAIALLGGGGPQPMSLGAHVQGALRIALCVALPAMIIAGLVQPRRYVRTFCVGALFPALTALTIVCLRCGFFLLGMHKYLQAYGRRGILMTLDVLWQHLPQLRYEVAAAWTLAFTCGTGAVLLERVFPPCDEAIEPGGVIQRRRYVWRWTLFWVATAALVGLALAPPHIGLALRVRKYLTITLSMALQASLVVGAVRSRGAVRAFCIGAALASCLAWALVCQTLLSDAVNRGNIFGQFRSDMLHRYSFAAAWVFAPLFGLTCAAFHRLFQLGDALNKVPATPAEKHGTAAGL